MSSKINREVQELHFQDEEITERDPPKYLSYIESIVYELNKSARAILDEQRNKKSKKSFFFCLHGIETGSLCYYADEKVLLKDHCKKQKHFVNVFEYYQEAKRRRIKREEMYSHTFRGKRSRSRSRERQRSTSTYDQRGMDSRQRERNREESVSEQRGQWDKRRERREKSWRREEDRYASGYQDSSPGRHQLSRLHSSQSRSLSRHRQSPTQHPPSSSRHRSRSSRSVSRSPSPLSGLQLRQEEEGKRRATGVRGAVIDRSPDRYLYEKSSDGPSESLRNLEPKMGRKRYGIGINRIDTKKPLRIEHKSSFTCNQCGKVFEKQVDLVNHTQLFERMGTCPIIPDALKARSQDRSNVPAYSRFTIRDSKQDVSREAGRSKSPYHTSSPSPSPPPSSRGDRHALPPLNGGSSPEYQIQASPSPGPESQSDLPTITSGVASSISVEGCQISDDTAVRIATATAMAITPDTSSRIGAALQGPRPTTPPSSGARRKLPMDMSTSSDSDISPIKLPSDLNTYDYTDIIADVEEEEPNLETDGTVKGDGDSVPSAVLKVGLLRVKGFAKTETSNSILDPQKTIIARQIVTPASAEAITTTSNRAVMADPGKAVKLPNWPKPVSASFPPSLATANRKADTETVTSDPLKAVTLNLPKPVPSVVTKPVGLTTNLQAAAASVTTVGTTAVAPSVKSACPAVPDSPLSPDNAEDKEASAQEQGLREEEKERGRKKTSVDETNVKTVKDRKKEEEQSLDLLLDKKKRKAFLNPGSKLTPEENGAAALVSLAVSRRLSEEGLSKSVKDPKHNLKRMDSQLVSSQLGIRGTKAKAPFSNVFVKQSNNSSQVHKKTLDPSSKVPEIFSKVKEVSKSHSSQTHGKSTASPSEAKAKLPPPTSQVLSEPSLDRHSKTRLNECSSLVKEKKRAKEKKQKKDKEKEKRLEKEKEKIQAKEKEKIQAKEKEKIQAKEKEKIQTKEKVKNQAKEKEKIQGKGKEKNQATEKEKSQAKEKEKMQAKEKEKMRAKEKKQKDSEKKKKSKDKKKDSLEKTHKERSKDKKRDSSEKTNKDKSKDKKSEKKERVKETAHSGEIDAVKPDKRKLNPDSSENNMEVSSRLAEKKQRLDFDVEGHAAVDTSRSAVSMERELVRVESPPSINNVRPIANSERQKENSVSPEDKLHKTNHNKRLRVPDSIEPECAKKICPDNMVAGPLTANVFADPNSDDNNSHPTHKDPLTVVPQSDIQCTSEEATKDFSHSLAGLPVVDDELDYCGSETSVETVRYTPSKISDIYEHQMLENKDVKVNTMEQPPVKEWKEEEKVEKISLMEYESQEIYKEGEENGNRQDEEKRESTLLEQKNQEKEKEILQQDCSTECNVIPKNVSSLTNKENSSPPTAAPTNSQNSPPVGQPTEQVENRGDEESLDADQVTVEENEMEVEGEVVEQRESTEELVVEGEEEGDYGGTSFDFLHNPVHSEVPKIADSLRKGCTVLEEFVLYKDKDVIDICPSCYKELSERDTERLDISDLSVIVYCCSCSVKIRIRNCISSTNLQNIALRFN